LHRAELTVCCRLIRFSWHGASCPRKILIFSTLSSPEVQKRRGADVDFQAVWVHVSNQEHQVSPRGVSDWWRESVPKSVSVHQDKIRGSAIMLTRDRPRYEAPHNGGRDGRSSLIGRLRPRLSPVSQQPRSRGWRPSISFHPICEHFCCAVKITPTPARRKTGLRRHLRVDHVHMCSPSRQGLSEIPVQDRGKFSRNLAHVSSCPPA